MALDDVADELYALAPEDFTAARDEAARQARSDGNRDLAAEIKALRRPSVSAYAVNALAATHPDDLAQLADLGRQLRDAMTGKGGGDLRALTEQRRQAVATLVGLARRAADRDLTPAQDGEVAATLEAATADPQLAAAVRSGRLVKPLRYAGFGALPDLDDALGVAPTTRAAAGPPKKPRKPAKPAAKTPAPKPPAEADERSQQLIEARERALDASGVADDAQQAYDGAVGAADRAAAEVDEIDKELTALRRRLGELERRRSNAVSSRDRALRDREAAYERAQKAHAEADRLRRAVGRLERE